ncbi:hypothetical protein HYH03_009671 [Edaphochlamys debaryana]|uniref:Uncharacterized protein n=1 Tax=Edaphochlamys debaryana TaxID=47281 RepID=A0A836BY54_9CHLO|nr:hypothetical protein HYH03_009671 [Edaphochlamys debaryana]|eukprot:KAG2491938.1 hypothetical protein HYH03_009671 [Edaphochlamys debaryana]
MAPLRCLMIVMLAACVLASYEDYADKDDFWAPPPPPLTPPPKESIDERTGAKLVATTFRFFQARLKPDKTRTREQANKIADELNEMFVDEGVSHNKASAATTHVLSIQTRDEFDEIKHIVFGHPKVVDVMIKDGLRTRDGPHPTFLELWRAEMGPDAPEPLFESKSQPPPEAEGKKKKKKKGKGKKKGKKGGEL